MAKYLKFDEGAEDKLKIFSEWIKKEGVLMPKLEFPAFFENDELLGVRCKEDIQHREAYLYVPYKMLLSVKSTQAHPVLGPIVSAHPEAFDRDEVDEWDQMILSLALFYEMTLGKSSYWYPYMISMSEGKFLCK
jgi:hypothetical protein